MNSMAGILLRFKSSAGIQMISLILMWVLCSFAPTAEAAPSSFTVYIRRKFLEPDSTVIATFPPFSTPSNPVKTQVLVSDNFILASPSTTSNVLGFQRDERRLGFRDDDLLESHANGLLVFRRTYNGTIAFEGILKAGSTPSPPADELGITGGTGEFRGASGYITSLVLNYNPSNGIQLLQWNITICSLSCKAP